MSGATFEWAIISHKEKTSKFTSCDIYFRRKILECPDNLHLKVPGKLDAILAFVTAIRQTLPACLDTEWPCNAAGLARLFLGNRERC